MNNIFIMSAKKIGIGEKIREVRTRMGMNQKDFAQLVESSASSISGYELEDVPVPADILRNITLKCKVSADWLLTGENPEVIKNANERHLIEAFREAERYNEQTEIIKYTDWKVKEYRAKYKTRKGIHPHKSKTIRYKAGSG